MNKKIYHYDPVDFFYIGSETIYGYEDERGMIPYAATDICPPSRDQWPTGHVPIFSEEQGTWHFHKDDFWSVKLDERCFYTGQDSLGATYVVAARDHLDYSNELLKYGNSLPIAAIPRIGSVPGVLHIGQRIDYINFCVEQIEGNWQSIKTTSGFRMFGGEANLHHFFSESLISSIRRLLDDLTTAFFLKTFQKYTPWKRSLIIDGYSALLGEKAKQRVDKVFPPDVHRIDANKLRDNFISIIVGKNRVFLEMIQGMNNAYKHSITANITRQLYGSDFPTLLAVGIADHSPDRNLGMLVFYNHSLRQVIMGLNDYLNDLTDRIAGHNQLSSYVERCETHRISSDFRILNGPALRQVDEADSSRDEYWTSH